LPSVAGEEDYECDLPGCQQIATYAPDEEEWPPEPPPGWFSVVVARNDAQNVTLIYCSQEHLALGVAEHLPEAQAALHDVGGWRDDVLGCSAVLVFLAVLVLGLITGIVLIVDAGQWLLGRF
jgi:hypothetical protein